MAYQDLNEFIGILEDKGQLVRVTEPISPHLEITEVTDRVTKAGGPALIFENVLSPSGHPVAINLFGSMDRVRLALEVEDLDQLASDIMEFLEAEKAEGILQKLKLIPKVKRMGSIFPKKVKKAPCQDIEFDRQMGLMSIPAKMGARRALQLSSFLHFLCSLFFVLTGLVAALPWPYFAGVAVAAILLIIEHRIVSGARLEKIDLAFFTVNSYVSLTLLAGVAVSLLL